MVQRDQVPEEVHDIEEWIQEKFTIEDALGQGDVIGVIGQTDYTFSNGETLTAGGEVTNTVNAPGGDKINGQARSTGQYSLFVRWLDGEDGNVVREEGISSNLKAGNWANFGLDPKSPFAEIVVKDRSGAEQTVDMTVHYR